MSSSQPIYENTASWYARYRPGFPQNLIDRIVGDFAVDRNSTILDLGCGTGQMTIPLAGFAGRVIGIDPSPDMLTEARRCAEEAGSDNITWVLGTAEDHVARVTAQVVVAARSFHWMSREALLQKLDAVVAPDGGFVVITDYGPRSQRQDWQRAASDVVTSYLGPDRVRGEGIADHGGEIHETVIGRSAFSHIDKLVFLVERRWTPASVVGHLHTAPWAEPSLFGTRRAAFAQDVEEALVPFADQNGELVEPVAVEALFCRRP